MSQRSVERVCAVCADRGVLCDEAAGGEELAAGRSGAPAGLAHFHAMYECAVDRLPLKNPSVQKVQGLQGGDVQGCQHDPQGTVVP